MNVAKNVWVNLTYNLTDSQGHALEEKNQSVRYLHGGYGVLFPKLEAALEGKSIGQTVTVYLEPFDHFGEYDASRIFIHQMSEFEDNGASLQQGDLVQGRPGVPDDGGEYRVSHIANAVVILDGNHPYSEMSLRYELTINALELATQDDIATQRAAQAFAEQNDEDDDFGEVAGQTGLQ
jgi:FKBP-type peptidyl-prolyl cis-trans isomerase SlyD